jgi:hypothetical protein
LAKEENISVLCEELELNTDYAVGIVGLMGFASQFPYWWASIIPKLSNRRFENRTTCFSWVNPDIENVIRFVIPIAFIF